MRALVTGGAGFIGSNLADALLDRGDAVTVVDNLASGKRENITGALARGAAFEEADIRDAGRMRAVLSATRPDIVFHLAAQIDVRKSIEDPAWDAGVNVVGTVNVLEAARETGVKRVVNTSTGGAIYGDADVTPTPESAPSRPMAAYGQSKFCAEAYCGWYERLYGLSSVILRYGNVYGPRQDPLGEAGVIAIFCGKVLAGGRPTIFGDGRQTRDYVYVGDVARANLLAAESDAGGPFNIGLGEEVDVLELVEALRPHGADGFDPEHAPERPGEVRRIALDCSRAREELGWEAKVGLEKGLERTLASLR